MKPITFDRLCYRIDGRPVYLNSGEFHYFRVPKADWRRRMELFKAAGGNCIATYVPWLIHEPQEGRLVFHSDDGVLDLEGFLSLAEEVGIYVLARPGPYVYSELLHAGLPDWLMKNYPQLRAKRLDGTVLGSFSISYVHPLLLEKARRFFAAAVPILARHTTSRGGCIPAVQIDNELAGVHVWQGSLDYNPESMGFGRPDGRYPTFLRKKYGDVAALNAAYGTDFADFPAVMPTEGGTWSAQEVRRLKDYFDFYCGTMAEYLGTLRDWCTEFGIDVPLVHNSGNPSLNSLFVESAAKLGNKQFLLGSDHYYSLEGQNNPTPEYAIKSFYSLQMLELMGYPPTVYELPSGAVFDFPPATCQDEKAAYLTNIAFGMKGHNYYILTGGPNPPGTGTTTADYDYNAPIGSKNEIRPLYYTQKEFAEFLADNAWLLTAERESDLRLALDWDHSRASYYWKGRGDRLQSGSDAWDLLRRGLMTTSFCGSYSPVLVDLRRQDWLADKTTPVAVACGDCMPRLGQRQIVEFLQAGGNVLLTPVLPTLDEDLQPCTILADFLGGLRSRKGSDRPVVAETGVELYSITSYFTDNLPSQADVLAATPAGQPVIWSLRTDGGGRVSMLATSWKHTRWQHIAMLDAALKPLGCRRKVQCSNPNVWTSLRTSEGRSMLFLLNLFTGTMQADISCQPSWSDKAIDLGQQTVPGMTVATIDVR